MVVMIFPCGILLSSNLVFAFIHSEIRMESLYKKKEMFFPS